MDLEKARKILEFDPSKSDAENYRLSDILDLCEATWFFQGKTGEPHAILTSKKHSDGYINMNAALQFTNIGEVLARRIIFERFSFIAEKPSGLEKVDAVVSSSSAAITFGQELARQMGAMFVFTEKEGSDQKWSGRFDLPKGTRVLQAEELITTLKTTRKVKEAVLNSNSEVDFVEVDGKIAVATIFHRPEKLPIPDTDYTVISLAEKEIHNWPPDECPLCKKGSIALEPKSNWQRFLQYR